MQGRGHPAGNWEAAFGTLASGRGKQQGRLELQESEQEGPGMPGAEFTFPQQATGTERPVLFQQECVLRATVLWKATWGAGETGREALAA